MTNITLQRRHGPSCIAGQKKGSYTFEPDERKRGAKPCRCPIYACGTLGGVYQRLPTGRRDWTEAQRILHPYLVAGSWEIEPPPPVAPPPTSTPAPTHEENRVTIEGAIQACYANHKSLQSADTTVRAYRTLLDDFRRKSEALGFRWLVEWKRSHVREWRNSWTCSARTTRKKMGYLKSFFEPFVEDESIPTNPARIKTHANRAMRDGGQKNPYTDEELLRMLEGCRKMQATKSKVVEIRQAGFTGDDLADFIEVSCWTGLRISDVATFDIDRLTKDGEVKLRCHKNGNWISVWIPEWLRAIIQRRAKTVGPRIFGDYRDIQRACEKWRRRLVTLWKRTGPWSTPATHHRFRHTFVRRLLEQEVSPALVAELIGDTEQMVRRSYSGWIKSRQQAATQILEKAFADAPRYHR